MHALEAYLTMPVPLCTASVSVCACFFFASAILLKVSKGKGRNGKESKGMEWELLCSVLYILLDTCLARSSTSTNNERPQPPLHPNAKFHSFILT